MLPEHLIDLPGVGDALQYGLAFTRGNAVLQFAEVAQEVRPD
jgi:hypothetical protein